MTFRETIADMMAYVHKIPLELALQQADRMSLDELQQRFRRYTRARSSGVELSAASPKLSAGAASSAQVSRPATMTAGSPALNPISEAAKRMPDSERKKPGQSMGAAQKPRSRKGFEVFT